MLAAALFAFTFVQAYLGDGTALAARRAGRPTGHRRIDQLDVLAVRASTRKLAGKNSRPKPCLR